MKWVAPEGHARLKAFNILCVSKVKHCMLYIGRLNTREMHIKYYNKLVFTIEVNCDTQNVKLFYN